MSVISFIDNFTSLSIKQELFATRLQPVLFTFFVITWLSSLLTFIGIIPFIFLDLFYYGFITHSSYGYIFFFSAFSILFSAFASIFVEFISVIFTKIFVPRK